MPPMHAASGRPSVATTLGFPAALTLLFAAGLLARLRALPAVFAGDRVFLAPTDAYYYARLAKLSADAFPAAATFDGFTAWPGMEIQWPPGHALLLSLFLRLGGGEPFSPAGLTALAWSGPVLSLVGTLALTLLAARWLGRAPALVLGATLLFLPDAVVIGEVGEANHHVHELFFGALVPLLFLRALAPARRPLAFAAAAGVARAMGLARGPLAFAAAAGVAAGLAHLCSSSGFLLLPPLALSVVAAHFLVRPRRYRRARALLVASGAALVVVVSGAAWVHRLSAIDYVRLSGFHVVVLACVVLLAAGLFLRAPGRTRLPLLAGAAAATLVAAAVKPLAAAALLATGHLGRNSQILSQADESRPLFSGGLSSAAESLGFGLVAVPLVVGLLFRGALARRPRAALLLGCLLPVLGAALLQNRFVRPLGGVLAVAAAVALCEALRAGQQRLPRLVAAAAAIALALPLPGLFEPRAPSRVLTLVQSALDFLREQTPSAGDPWDAAARPAWAVLSPWTIGHLVITLGERPAVATPFGQVAEAEAAVESSLTVFGATDQRRARDRGRAAGARYLLVTPWPGGEEALEDEAGPPEEPGHPRVLAQLREGAADPAFFRELFVSEEQFEGLPATRIFELVEPQDG